MNASLRNITVKDFFRTVTVIYFALFTGMLMITAVLFFLRHTNENNPAPPFDKTIALLVAGAVTALCIAGGRFIYAGFCKKINTAASVASKFTLYRSGVIIQFALTEGPCFVSAIFFFLTGYYELLGFAGICILYFLTLRPSKEKFIQAVGDADLKTLNVIDDPGAVILQTARMEND